MYPPNQPYQPSVNPTKSPSRFRRFTNWFRTRNRPIQIGLGCGTLIIALLPCAAFGGILQALGYTAPTPTPASQANATTTTATDSTLPTATPTHAISLPTATAKPTQPIATATTRPTPTPTPRPIYPPKTKADLMALAALGDASAIHEFHSESVGAVGVCPEPKRLVTVDPSITGKQLAEDLLAYFYSNQIDCPCGSVVFAFHTQAESAADNGYTAGRVLFDTANQDGSGNYDPNATGLKETLTLDTGSVLGPEQESIVTYNQ